MNTVKKFRIPIFNYGMIVRIFDKYSDVQDMPDFKNVLGRTIDYDDYCIVVIKKGSYDTIVHESIHVKNLIWSYIGYKPQRDNDEVDAYLVTYIYGKIMKAHNSHNHM